MAQIGNLGSLIIFEVSSNKVLTFDGLRRTVKGRWATHTVIGAKPVPEFLGPDRQSIVLPVFVTAAHGVRPQEVIGNMERAAENGTPFSFVVGGRKIGSHQWVIENVSETWGEIIDNGRLLSAHLDITISEYV